MDSTDYSLSTTEDLSALIGHRDEQIRELMRQLDQSQMQSATWMARLTENANARNSLQLDLNRAYEALEASRAELEATLLRHAKLDNLPLQQK